MQLTSQEKEKISLLIKYTPAELKEFLDNIESIYVLMDIVKKEIENTKHTHVR